MQIFKTKEDKRPDYAIHAAHKRAMKRKVIAVLVVCFAAYFFLLVPETLVAYVETSAGKYAGVIAKLVGAAGIGPILAFVLFATDGALKGSSRSARWVRTRFPAEAAVRRLKCSHREASTIWFRYFDTWALPGSPNRAILENNYSATYSARLVFYVLRSCLFLAVLSTITITANLFVLHAYGLGSYLERARSPAFILHLALLFAYAGVAILLALTNRSGAGGGEPTGCWARVEDIFGRSETLFEAEVLRDATDVKSALARVDVIRRELLEATTPAPPAEAGGEKPDNG